MTDELTDYEKIVAAQAKIMRAIGEVIQTLLDGFVVAWKKTSPPELLEYYDELNRREAKKQRYLRRYNRRRKS